MTRMREQRKWRELADLLKAMAGLITAVTALYLALAKSGAIH